MIGDNVWISTRVIILHGINIGNHIIIVAGGPIFNCQIAVEVGQFLVAVDKYDYFGNNVASHLFEMGDCLPSDTKMTDKDLHRVVLTIRNLFYDA